MLALGQLCSPPCGCKEVLQGYLYRVKTQDKYKAVAPIQGHTGGEDAELRSSPPLPSSQVDLIKLVPSGPFWAWFLSFTHQYLRPTLPVPVPVLSTEVGTVTKEDRHALRKLALSEGVTWVSRVSHVVLLLPGFLQGGRR